jgi:hypothetical protein
MFLLIRNLTGITVKIIASKTTMKRIKNASLKDTLMGNGSPPEFGINNR